MHSNFKDIKLSNILLNYSSSHPSHSVIIERIMNLRKHTANSIIVVVCACFLVLTPRCSCAVTKQSSSTHHACGHDRGASQQGHHSGSTEKSCCSVISAIQNKSYLTVSEIAPQNLLFDSFKNNNPNLQCNYSRLLNISQINQPVHLSYFPQFYIHTRGPPSP